VRRALALTLLAAGCASQNLSRARAELPAPLAEACLVASVGSEEGVVGFREVPEDEGPAWAFQLDEANLGTPAPPEVLLRQRPSNEGGTALVLEASFDARRGYGMVGREVVLQREREILGRAVERCSDAELVFGPERACGSGEPGTVCVVGHPGAPPEIR
jgi:hypothetical protein